MFQFLGAVRDAHGVVTRTLLIAYAGTLDAATQQNFQSIGEKRRDLFFSRWRRLVISWVVDAWEGLPLRLFQDAMERHVLEPATTKAIGNRPVALVAIPAVVNVDALLDALSNLTLPVGSSDEVGGNN